ncbi:TetR/AcrR family transcriptional regulator [Pararhizobium sp. DWP1-1-3]|uniref:TetR/AcrR family transcriptional regulator n=1 Tax=Pararhizobium sp. DWP1-1-3 TaxID=2804652 RepID=UPI003CF55D8E
MEQQAKNLGGRPRRFDRNTAVEIAMRLFWRNGYEGVSVADLTDAIGIAPPSLYAAFGSKAELYRETLRHYAEKSNSFDISVFDRAPGLSLAISEMLHKAVLSVTDSEGEKGCMIASGMVVANPQNVDLQKEIAERRSEFRNVLQEKMAFWVGEQEALRLSRYLTAVMQGISIQAHDGATAGELQMIVDEVLKGLSFQQPDNE